MSDLGHSPRAAKNGAACSADTGTCPGAARLPLPATVRLDNVVWMYAIPFAVIHLAALAVLIPWLFSWTGVALAVLGVPFYGIGITLGYHRLLAHRSLTVPKWLEHGFALFAQCSLQDTPAKWVTVHRMHHVFSDEQPDPHSPLVSFLWSHFNWLFYQNTATRTISAMQKYAHDLLEDPFYMKLEKSYLGPAIYLVHLLVYPIIGAVAGWLTTRTPIGALQFSLSLFVWGGLVRTVLGWHVTWSVNSLTHLFGYRNYETNESSRNNWFVGLVALGEGWHNNHHSDPAAASVWHRWWEFDLTYCVIFVLERLGLATKVIEPKAVRRARISRKARDTERVVSSGVGGDFVFRDQPAPRKSHKDLQRANRSRGHEN
jgi:stearoyl-CoA desaturase (delta-9 desaturase)